MALAAALGRQRLQFRLRSNLETKAQQWNVNHQADVALTTEQGGLKISLIEILTQFGAFVEIKANGDAALIQSTGLDVRASNTTAVGLLGQVQNLSATVGDHDGELDLTGTTSAARRVIWFREFVGNRILI